MINKKLIYVAGPITIGLLEENVRNAVKAGTMIMDLGHAAIVPHLTVFWNMITLRPYSDWIKMDEIMIERCDAVYRIPGESKGADHETMLASKLGIPIFFHAFSLRIFLNNEATVKQFISNLSSSGVRDKSVS